MGGLVKTPQQKQQPPMPMLDPLLISKANQRKRAQKMQLGSIMGDALGG